MSLVRRFEHLGEECVVCFPSEGDERLYMPLCGISRCPPDYRIERTLSRECVIEYVISGRGVFQIDGHTYRPEGGDVYIAVCGTTHRYQTDPDNCWCKIWFNIQGTLINELIRFYSLENVAYIPCVGKAGEKLFIHCLDEMKNNPENAHEHATLAAHRLVYFLSRFLYSGDSSHHGNPIAVELKKWLEQHAAERMCLRALSAKFGYSASQLNRIFHQDCGESLYGFFLRKKLELGAVMLRNTDKSVKEIAAALQISDPYYFSNLFKRKYGVSPRRFRNPGGGETIEKLPVS